jgi:excisionase family DNA binding protein
MEINKEWLSVQEAADYLGVARPTIYRWAKESKIHIFKLAKGVARVKRQDLEAFLQQAPVLYSEPADHGDHATQPGFVRETARQQSQTADPILDVLGSLSGEPISAEEIEKELHGNEEMS